MTLRLDWAGGIGQSGTVTGRGWQKVADLVVAGRLKLGYTSRPQFATASGVSKRTLGTLERGNPVSPRTLRAIETKLGMRPGYLDKVRDTPEGRPLVSDGVTDTNRAAIEVDAPEDESILDAHGKPYLDAQGVPVTPAGVNLVLDAALRYGGVDSWRRALTDMAHRYGLPMSDPDE